MVSVGIICLAVSNINMERISHETSLTFPIYILLCVIGKPVHRAHINLFVRKRNWNNNTCIIQQVHKGGVPEETIMPRDSGGMRCYRTEDAVDRSSSPC